jgi:hypothetical protein
LALNSPIWEKAPITITEDRGFNKRTTIKPDIGGEPMTWLEHYKLSEESAQLAEAALRQQNPQQAQIFYAQAAQAEILALADLDRTKTRTLGITVVSTVALSYKAQAFHQAKQIAYQWLATAPLPPFAVQSLRERLLDIWQQQPKAIAS